MKLILVYVTNPTKKEALKVANHLVEKKLIGCANIFPVDSIYRWEGKIAHQKEFVFIAKTKEANFVKIKKEVKRIHSYSVPCVIKIPACAGDKYYSWLGSVIE